MTKSKSAQGKIYYGWIVVAASFVAWAVAFGTQYSFGIFFKPLQEALGLSRAATSWAMTVHVIAFALSLVVAGWAIDRFSARAVFFVGAVLAGLSLVLSSRISQPWQLYLLYGLLGIGLGVYGPVLAITARWFTRRRGLALGITSAGVGFGTLIIAPLSHSLIASYGWRDSFTVLGVAAFIILLICAFFVQNSPRTDTNGSQQAVTESTGNHQPARYSPPGMTLTQAIRTRSLALLVLAHVFTSFTLRMVMVHVAPYATDAGISPSVAALAVGAIGASSILGRILMGFAQDKIGAQRCMVICLATQAVCMLALPFIRSDGLFFVYAAVFGFVYGGDMPQVPAIAVHCFGLPSITVIYGLVTGIANLGGAAGPRVAGYVFDLSGSYTSVFLAASALMFVAAFCIWRLRAPALSLHSSQ